MKIILIINIIVYIVAIFIMYLITQNSPLCSSMLVIGLILIVVTAAMFFASGRAFNELEKDDED